MLFGLKLKNVLFALLGSAILAFGLYHIHSFSLVTEGGQLGLSLLLQHWFSISPAYFTVIANIIGFLIGWKTFGKSFIVCSGVCTAGFSLTYWICEQFPPLWPQLVDHPVLACLVGAVFVGVGVGLCVYNGGAPSGDDALAMSICHRFKIEIQWVYLIFDLAVIGLSLTYIPWQRIVFSIISSTISSWIVGLIQRIPKKDTTI